MPRTAPRTAIVTGSTSGIGEGIARALAAAGNNVVLNGFGEPAAIEKLRVSIAAEHNVTCLYSSADMTKPEQIEAMFSTVKGQLGPIDILVNNAGVNLPKRYMHQLTPESIRALVDGRD
jgi:3-hydroxybutyrate dehydrogenase